MEYDDPPKKYNSITYTVNYDKLYESSIQWRPPKDIKDMEEQIETLLEKIVELSDYKDAKQIIDTIRKMP
jgi:hypothetical protein